MADETTSEGYGVEPVVAPPVQPLPLPYELRVDLSDKDVLCRRCGFNLRGLTPERNCPECGFPIERTLLGDPLIFSSRAYLQTLSTGLKWILITTLVQIVVSIVATIVGFAVAFATRANSLQAFEYVQIAALMIGVPTNAALLFGWWRFSTPDPDIMSGGSGDSGDTPRVIVRWATVLLVCTAILASIAPFFKADMMEIDFFSAGAGLLSAIASMTQFFASLLYMRWIARRMQEVKLAETTSRYLWLLPLIYIVGACFFGLGPLLAFVLYLLLLNQVRVGINTTIARQEADAALIPAR